MASRRTLAPAVWPVAGRSRLVARCRRNASPASTPASCTWNDPRCTCTSRASRCSTRVADGPLTYDDVAAGRARRVSISRPRLRQRVLRVPGDFARPLWVDDDALRSGLPPAARRRSRRPGGRFQLERAVGTRPVASARPVEAAVGALRLRGTGAPPDRGPAEDAPRAGGRHLGHADRLGAVRPVARRRTRARLPSTPWVPEHRPIALELWSATRSRTWCCTRSRRSARPSGHRNARSPTWSRDVSGVRDVIGMGAPPPGPFDVDDRARPAGSRPPRSPFERLREIKNAARWHDQRRGAHRRRGGAARTPEGARRAHEGPDAPRDGAGVGPIEGRAWATSATAWRPRSSTSRSAR